MNINTYINTDIYIYCIYTYIYIYHILYLEDVPFRNDSDGVCSSAGDVGVVVDLDLLHGVLAEVLVVLVARDLK